MRRPPLNKAKYKQYLKSEKWAEKKFELFLLRGEKCERCQSETDIQVHHKTYRTIFNEDLEDLEILCSNCHKAEHDAKDLRKKQEEDRWMALRDAPKEYRPVQQSVDNSSALPGIFFLLFIISWLLFVFFHIEICGIICGVMFFIFIIGYAFSRGRRHR
ncbi:MAG TPA: HNH endonuclease signature motif containing protein [Bacteroidia bacterium]|jgi:hypothetical protein|nr:HNH endonuclease signature motif containing protein [Bacteroidia bacterium]